MKRAHHRFALPVGLVPIQRRASLTSDDALDGMAMADRPRALSSDLVVLDFLNRRGVNSEPRASQV